MQINLASHKSRLFLVKLPVPHHRLIYDGLFSETVFVKTLLVVDNHKVYSFQVLLCLRLGMSALFVQIWIARNIKNVQALVVCIV